MRGKYYVGQGSVPEVLRKVKPGSVNLILTSPPYNVGIEYDVYGDRMPWPDYYRWIENWLHACYNLLSDDGRMLIMHYFSCGDTKYGRAYPLMHINEMAVDMGYRHHAVIFWEDVTISRRTAWGSWLSSSAPYINSPYEGILVLHKGETWKRYTRGYTDISKEEFMEGCLGVWRMSPDKGDAREAHPAPFPYALADRAIRLFSYVGDVVLDPFVGRGTTVAAAVANGRRGIGFDISSKYCQQAIEWADEKQYELLKGGDDGEE